MSSLIDQIDALLPQTQCRDCEYEDCRSYATAIANDHEAPNKCLPGGEATFENIAHLIQVDPEPYRASIQANTKAIKLATIREVDAIIGASKQMHTIITDVCNGCGLCLPPCPVDCIDWLPSEERTRNDVFAMADQSRERYHLSLERRERNRQRDKAKHQHAKLQQGSTQETLDARKRAMAEAMQRAKAKKRSS